MKKLLIFVLAASLSLSGTAAAFASDADISESEEQWQVEYAAEENVNDDYEAVEQTEIEYICEDSENPVQIEETAAEIRSEETAEEIAVTTEELASDAEETEEDADTEETENTEAASEAEKETVEIETVTEAETEEIETVEEETTAAEEQESAEEVTTEENEDTAESESEEETAEEETSGETEEKTGGRFAGMNKAEIIAFVKSVEEEAYPEFVESISAEEWAYVYEQFGIAEDLDEEETEAIMAEIQEVFGINGAELLAEISGECGTYLRWSYGSGTLTISGTGAMFDYSESSIPWKNYKSSITRVVVNSGATSLSDYAFSGCANLTSVTISGSGIKTIGAYAFYNCSKLRSISLPNSITSIGACALAGTGLTSLTLPGSLEYLGYGFLYGNTGVTSIIIPGTLAGIGHQYNSNESNNGPFDGSRVATVTLNSGLKTIYGGMFKGAAYLQRVEIAPTVTTIGNYAFEDCANLTSIYIPGSVTRIGACALAGTGLTSLTLPGSLEYLGYGFLYGNTGVTSIIIPGTLTGIGHQYNSNESNNGPFDGSRVATVTLNSGLKTIYGGMFKGAAYLKKVYIPATVTSIGNYAFNNCSNLTDIYYYGSATNWRKVSVGSNNTPVTTATIHYTIGSIQNLTTGNAVNGVTLSWTSTYAADGYEIFRRDENSSTFTSIGRTSGKTYTDKTVKSNKVYYYKVRGYNVVNGKYTYSDFGKTVMKGYIAQTASVTAKSTTTGLQLSWAAISGTRGYQIWRQTYGSSTWTYIAAATTTSYNDTTAKANTKYIYYVRAYNKAANGTVYYGTFSAGKATGRIPQVKGVSAASVSNGIKLSWTAISGTRGYQIYRKTSSESSYTRIGTAATAYYTDTTAKYGVTYDYMVRGYNLASDGTTYYGVFSASLRKTR